MIALRMLMDIHLAEKPEERDPQDKQYRVPDKQQSDARHKRDEVEECRDGGEGGYDFCVDLYIVSDALEVGRERKHTHFPSLYLCSRFAACRSTP